GEPEQHPDRGRLARSVGAEEPVHAATGDREIQGLDRDDSPAPTGAELLAESAGLDDRARHGRTSRSGPWAVGAQTGEGNPAPSTSRTAGPAAARRRGIAIRRRGRAA